MSATIYRQVCGTHLGLIAHNAADEPLCGECAHAELVRRVSVEAWPVGVRHPALVPISRRQAEQNLAVLVDAMADEPAVEPAGPGPSDTHRPQPVQTPVDVAASAVNRTDAEERA